MTVEASAPPAAGVTPKSVKPNVTEYLAQLPSLPTIKLIVTDVDGTIMSADFKISEATRCAYRAAWEKGVPVVLATGRGYSNTRDRFASAKFDHEARYLPGIFHEGQSVLDADGRGLKECAADPENLRQLHYLLKERYGERISISLDCHIGTYCVGEKLNEHGQWYVDVHLMPSQLVESFDELARRDEILITHATIVSEPAIIDEMAPLIHKEFPGVWDMRRYWPKIIHACKPGITKASAVTALALEMGIRPDEILVLGDGRNDADMLRVFPHSVGMGDGEDEAKEAAACITASLEDDGWAQAVSLFLDIQTRSVSSVSTTTASLTPIRNISQASVAD